MFISNHCPYVKHVAAELGRLGSDYGPRGVAVVAIGSNDVEHYPDDAPARMVEFAAANGFTLPVPPRRDAGGGARPTAPPARPTSSSSTPSASSSTAASSTALALRTTCPSTDATCAPRSTRPSTAPAGPRAAATEHGLQHQVEGRQRARLLPRLMAETRRRAPPGPTGLAARARGGRPAGLQAGRQLGRGRLVGRVSLAALRGHPGRAGTTMSSNRHGHGEYWFAVCRWAATSSSARSGSGARVTASTGSSSRSS